MEKKIKVRLKPSFNNFLVLTGPGMEYRIHVGGTYDPQGFEVTQMEYDKVFKNVVDVLEDIPITTFVSQVGNEKNSVVIKKSGEKTVRFNKGKGE